MNISQAKDNLTNQGIDISNINWESYSNDIPIEDWLKNEYSITLTYPLKEQALSLKEQQDYEDTKPKNKDIEFMSQLCEKSLICTILGARGEGKSCLGFYLLEQLKGRTKREICTVSFPEKTPFKNYPNLEDVPKDAIALLEESSLKFDARKAMSGENISMSNLLKISRHNNLSLILVTQNSADLEVRALRMTDVFLLKKPSLVQIHLERGFVKRLYQYISPIFQNDDNQKPFYYIFSDKLQGLFRFDIPSFWSENISKAHRLKTSVVPYLFPKTDSLKTKDLNIPTTLSNKGD